MTRLILPCLLVAATTLSASIRFDPPAPDSQTRVVAHVRGATGCPPAKATVTVIEFAISIKINQPCLLPSVATWDLSVDLGVLASGIYSVNTSTVNGGTFGSGLLVVRDATPAFTIVPDATYSGAPDTIRLTGKNLANCAPGSQCATPTVKFGGTVAEVISTSSDELVVRAPLHDAGPVDVTIDRGDATLRSVAAFYYVPGSAEPRNPAFYEPVLFPVIFTGPGAFGSRWDTEVVLRNENDYALTLQGGIFSVLCFPICDSRPQGHSTLKVNGLAYATGYVVLAPRQAAPQLHFGVLVRDLSHQAEALGTEIPVIRESEFFDRPFELLNVPTDPRFRVALRLYSVEGLITQPLVSFPVLPIKIWSSNSELLVSTNIQLLGSVGTVATPLFAQISDLVATYPELAGKGPLRIEINPGGSNGPRALWGFVSVTNNDTQHVTTISPQ